MSNQEALGLEEFLGYKTSGGKSSFLKKWTTSKEHTLNMVLFPRDSIYPLWRHPFPRIVTLEKEKTREVWGGNYVCWEDPSPTLIKQYQRDDDGMRKYPPQRCGACKMIEWIHQEIAAERIAWTDEIFRFEGDDSDKTRIMHAGGMTGAFGSKNLDDEEKQDLKDHRIRLREVWMEKVMPSASYMFIMVDFDDWKSGVQVTIEKASLGDKIKTVIMDAKKSFGEKGNPFTHPYVIQCEYDPADNIEFNKKYMARPMMGPDWKIRQDILDLLANEDPPDVSHITSRFNATELRMSLEEHALIEIPFDDFFGKLDPKEVEKLKAKEEKRSEKRDEKRESSSSSGKSQKREEAESSRKTDPAPEPDEDLDQCARCDDGFLKPDEDVCPSCHWNHETKVYDKPVEKRRRRGEPVETAGKTETKSETKSSTKTETKKADKKTPFADDGDDVPF